MTRILTNLFKSPPNGWAVISIFILIAILAYGLLIPYLGFFWDDFPLAWITHTYGGEGLERYFATNRPYLVPLYQITTRVLGITPWHWQVFGLICRILSAISFWFFLRHLWPKKPFVALFAGMAFLVYPGFMQQWIAIIYSHFFIFLSVLMLSMLCTILAIRSAYENCHTPRRIVYTILALCLSFVNLISIEYFFTLELIRNVTIWIVLGEYSQGFWERLRKTFAVGIPYLLLFFGVAAWRFIFFPYQTNNYQLSIIQRLADQPVQASLSLIQNIIGSLWNSSIAAWINIVHFPDLKEIGRITAFVSFSIVVITFLLISGWLYIVAKRSKASTDTANIKDRTSLQPLWLGFIALLVAGWPVWLIDRSPNLSFSMDRFTLPFMMGAALVIVGLLEILPLNITWKTVIFVSIISLAVGMHFRSANAYRRDWEVQKRFFWQLVWRIPGLESTTTLLTNELPVIHYSDNSLTAPLNWIYAPQNHSEDMAYLMLYPAQRLGGPSLPALEENISIDVDYLAATFRGSTSQIVSIFYEPPACLRVLDNKLDALNHMLPLLMQHSAELSDQNNILFETSTVLPELFYPEEEHGWCFYYEKAELARQHGDWQTVTSLGQSAFALGDYPNDPAERIPFIEGYARTGDWKLALQQTSEAISVSSDMNPVLCLLWERIDQDTPSSPEKDDAINHLSDLLSCTQ